MMKLSFNFPRFSTRSSRRGKSLQSVFSFGPWFVRTGRISAMAACLMAATPPLAFSQTPLPPQTATTASANEGLEALVASLKSEDPKVRKSAVEKLVWLPNPQSTIPALRETLKDADPIVRATAARAIWEIDRNAEESVPVLVDLLKSPNNNHRELAAYFLGPMTDAAGSAIPALRQAMRDQEVSVQIHAAEALAQIDPQGTEAVDVLVKAMKHADPAVRSVAAMAFGNVDPVHAERVVPVLMAAVADPDPGVRTSAEVSLPTFNLDVSHSGQQPLGEPAENQVLHADLTAEEPLLPTAANTTPFASPEEHAQADTEAEENIPGLSPELVKAVRDLASDSPAVRRSALDRIAWMGSAAEAVVPEVIACLNDPHPGIRAYAAKTLWDLDKQSGLAAINTLRDLLDSTQPGIRPLAAFYLGYIGPEAASTLPVLKRALANAESTEQLQIAEAVARINPEDADAVNVLIGGLRDPEAGVRFQAAYALSEVSPIHGPRVIPELATATKDQNPEVQRAAELALANFPAPAVAPKIEPANAEIPKTDVAQAAPVPVDKNETAKPTLKPTIQPVSEQPAVGAVEVAQLEPQPLNPVPAIPEQPPVPVEVVPAEPPVPVEVVPAEPPVPVEEVGEYEVIPTTPTETVYAPPRPVNRLGLGEDYKPITAVKVSIAPPRRDADGSLLALPTNYGAAWLQTLERHHEPRGHSRPWTVQAKQYAATGFCHRPLYFQELNLERYGHNFDCLQPFVSAGAFFGRVPLLPYMMAAEHPWECQHTLGHYRPGNCVPFQHVQLPWSKSGALLEAGVITGLFFAIY